MPGNTTSKPGSPAAHAAVAWRQGVHLNGTPIWCDARRPRDVCFVSCAHVERVPRSGQLIATAPTLALLAPRGSHSCLPVPYGQPFTLGQVRLELVRSGHALGGASLVANVHGQRILYAGAVSLRGGGLGGCADLRQCDIVVLDATYGHPRYKFPDVDEVAGAVADHALRVTRRGGVLVLLVSSPSKAMDVASQLAIHMATPKTNPWGPQTASQTTAKTVSQEAAGCQVAAPVAPSYGAHRSICEALRRLRPTHPNLPRLRRCTDRPRDGSVLLWPLRYRDVLVPLPARSEVVLVSGRAQDPDLAALAVDAAYPWSNHADYEDLMTYIHRCGAGQVYLTQRHAAAMAAAIDRAERPARVLAAPHQMPLFAQ